MTVENIVRNDVYVNCSALVSELASDPNYIDELAPALCGEDWEAAVDNYLVEADEDELHEAYEALDGSPGFLTWCHEETLRSHLRYFVDARAERGVSYREIAEDLEVEDPEEEEVFEHWIVSDWLARKLEDIGEPVVRDFLGLNIWGRTETGQALTQDAALNRVFRTLNAAA